MTFLHVYTGVEIFMVINKYFRKYSFRNWCIIIYLPGLISTNRCHFRQFDSFEGIWVEELDTTQGSPGVEMDPIHWISGAASIGGTLHLWLASIQAIPDVEMDPRIHQNLCILAVDVRPLWQCTSWRIRALGICCSHYIIVHCLRQLYFLRCWSRPRLYCLRIFHRSVCPNN